MKTGERRTQKSVAIPGDVHCFLRILSILEERTIKETCTSLLEDAAARKFAEDQDLLHEVEKAIEAGIIPPLNSEFTSRVLEKARKWKRY
jgi:hypothetical protein